MRKNTKARLERLDAVKKAYNAGTRSVKGLEEKLGFNSNVIYTYLATLGLRPVNGRTDPCNPARLREELEITKVVSDDIKMLKAGGLTKTEIGKIWGINAHRVAMVLNGTAKITKKKGS